MKVGLHDLRLGFIGLGMLILLACTSSKGVRTDEVTRSSSNANAIENPSQDLDLTTHLRKIPGLTVRGSGATATINVRAAASLNMSTDPLFVIDGNQIRDYSQVYHMVQVRDIRRIEVLKDASDTAFYGVTGANGVILITLKLK